MAMWVINPSVLLTRSVVSRSPKLAGHCTLSHVESSSGVAEAVSVPDTHATMNALVTIDWCNLWSVNYVSIFWYVNSVVWACEALRSELQVSCIFWKRRSQNWSPLLPSLIRYVWRWFSFYLNTHVMCMGSVTTKIRSWSHLNLVCFSWCQICRCLGYKKLEPNTIRMSLLPKLFSSNLIVKQIDLWTYTETCQFELQYANKEIFATHCSSCSLGQSRCIVDGKKLGVPIYAFFT